MVVAGSLVITRIRTKKSIETKIFNLKLSRTEIYYMKERRPKADGNIPMDALRAEKQDSEQFRRSCFCQKTQ